MWAVRQTVFDTEGLHDIPWSNQPLETGDLFVQKNWNKFNVLTYQHAGLISNAQTSPIERIDCTRITGCSIRPFTERNQHKEMIVARMPTDVPYRDEIIRESIAISKYLIQHHRVKYLQTSHYKVGQFLRVLVGKCMGQVGWDELSTYIRRFLSPYIHQTEYDTQTYAIFCNRFSMLIYQLAAWYVWTQHGMDNAEIASQLNAFFGYHPKFCRPWHIVMLGRHPNHPWHVYRTTTWFK